MKVQKELLQLMKYSASPRARNLDFLQNVVDLSGPTELSYKEQIDEYKLHSRRN